MRVTKLNFDENPFIVIWEVTRACSLACRHCRAEAVRRRHPLELDTAAGRGLIQQIVRAQPQQFVLTGGDPAQRPDLHELIGFSAGEGLRVSLSPSATPEFARADLAGLKRLGLARISLSLDGADRETHDRFRVVPGTWDWTLRILERAREAGLPVQINTTFTRQNLQQFEAFVALLRHLRPVLWSVFQLVPTGRARAKDLLTGVEMETLFEKLYDLSRPGLFEIKTTEGQHYRRVVAQKSRQDGWKPKRPLLPINDGKGFVFISHVGEVYPSGFLPLSAGNVRRDDLLDIYRNSPLFRQLRDPRLLGGKCGRCEFHNLCGGSRARAYAMTGDPFAEEPLCVYQPPARTPEPRTAGTTC
ncbi:MAG TPA: radical SAM protein [Methylomirabilota bacterium]|nr:radical SAM protein [Methylomirabilota bacterium]